MNTQRKSTSITGLVAAVLVHCNFGRCANHRKENAHLARRGARDRRGEGRGANDYRHLAASLQWWTTAAT